MLEDKFPELIQSVNSIRILVAASYKAKESLAAKGLTPAIFLDRFYRQKNKGPFEIGYSFKEKSIKPLPDFITIDLDDYDFIRREDKHSTDDIDENTLGKKIIEQMNNEQIKYQKDLTPQVFQNHANVQKLLNNQGFHWFQNSVKLFYHAISLGQYSFKTGTVDQPMGITFLIEVQKNRSCKQVFEKVKLSTDLMIRNCFEINPDQIKNIKILAIILYDASQEIKVEEALQYTTVLKKQYGISSSLIYRLQINGEDLHDSIEWSRFNRPILHFKYSLQASDPVRIINYEEFSKVQEIINFHKETIRKSIENRLEELIKRYEEVNKATKIIANFFRGSAPTEKHYNREEVQIRELADKMFLLQDYKKAYDIYRSIANKMEGRNQIIEISLSEMIQVCLILSKFHSIKLRSDPYGQIEKYSQKILKFYSQQSNRQRHRRYLIFLLYCFYTFKAFNQNFIKKFYYQSIKQSFSNNSQQPGNIISLLILEQYSNLHLMFNHIDYRKYCFEITKVGSRFSQYKLHQYSLRCFLVAEGLYRDTFANIQKYELLQLGNTSVLLSNYHESLIYLKKAWKVYVERIENQNLEKSDEQLKKFIDGYLKVIREIQKNAPEELSKFIEPNLEIPLINSLNLQVTDERLDFDEKSGLKWQIIGENILNSKQIMLPQQQFIRLFKSFDTGIPEQKYLLYRFKAPVINEQVLMKNSRNVYVEEPIRITFYFRNPLREEIQINNIRLIIKQGIKYKIEPQKIASVKIEAFKSSKISFIIVPMEPGFLELERIEWNFMKILCEYRIKQPMEMKSEEKLCYFKLNVLPAIGNLRAKAEFEQSYFEGEKGTMKLNLFNEGEKPIDKIYAAVGDNMFNFKLKELGLKLNAKQGHQVILDCIIPLISNHIQSGEQKKICKIILLYESDGKFRVSRTINKFNIVRVAKIQNIMCEQLSTHLHLLSFHRVNLSTSTKEERLGTSIKKESAALEWMIIPRNFQIVKAEAAELSVETRYFFFLRKGKYSQATYSFTKNADLKFYPEQMLSSQQSQQENSINVRFLWRKKQKYGIISPSKIPITVNEYGYLSSEFPINVKINFKRNISHDFQLEPFLEIPITIKLKNIYEPKGLKLTIYLADGKQLDACWEGTTEHKLKLEIDEEKKIEANYVIMRPGIYDISNEIKYTIENSSGRHRNITHSECEKIYLSVSNHHHHNHESEGYFSYSVPNFDNFDAFKEFETIHQKSQSDDLI